MMTRDERIERLIGIGGQRWTKGNMDRIYFNQLDQYIDGLDFSFYNSGNIQSCRFDGETVSNSKASGLLSSLANGKFWWDVHDQKFHWRISDNRLMESGETGHRILESIKRLSGYESILE